MADLGEVLVAIRDAAAAELHAEGLIQPGPNGKGLRVYVGWPDASLDADLALGIGHVSVYPRSGVARTLPGTLDGWLPLPIEPAGMAVEVAGDAATFSGIVARPDVLAAVIEDGRAWPVNLGVGQTPDAVVSALAALVAADRPAIPSGPVLTLPAARSLVARVVAGGSERRELERYAQGVLLTAWAPSDALRNRLIRILHATFADERRTLALPDGTKATINYGGTVYDDAARKHPLFRRDLMLEAEYALVETRPAPPVAVTRLDIDALPAAFRRTMIR